MEERGQTVEGSALPAPASSAFHHPPSTFHRCHFLNVYSSSATLTA